MTAATGSRLQFLRIAATLTVGVLLPTARAKADPYSYAHVEIQVTCQGKNYLFVSDLIGYCYDEAFPNAEAKETLENSRGIIAATCGTSDYSVTSVGLVNRSSDQEEAERMRNERLNNKTFSSVVSIEAASMYQAAKSCS